MDSIEERAKRLWAAIHDPDNHAKHRSLEEAPKQNVTLHKRLKLLLNYHQQSYCRRTG